jgi:hypothetical protein
MKIRMTQTIQGSLDGVTVCELTEGKVYETAASPRGDRLARYHVKQGAAVLMVDAPVSLKRPAPREK